MNKITSYDKIAYNIRMGISALVVGVAGGIAAHELGSGYENDPLGLILALLFTAWYGYDLAQRDRDRERHDNESA